MKKRLEDQVVIVTGGGSGLGKAVVKRFVRDGARVVVLDRNQSRIDELERDAPAEVSYCLGDVRDLAANQAAVEHALEHYGRLDCVIGNAGIWDYSLPLVDTEDDQLAPGFTELFETNVLGYMNLAKAALKPLAASKGSMIFTVSNAGFYPNGGGVLYTATKHAVVGFIRQMAYELAPHIRVNGVAPGAIPTNLSGAETLGLGSRAFPGDRLRENASESIPLARLNEVEEYAGAFVFFASREDHLPATGSILNHDGGFGIRGLGGRLRGGDRLLEKLGLGRD